MPFMVLLPYFDPSLTSFDTVEEAEAKAAEVLQTTPAVIAIVAEVTILGTYTGTVTVTKQPQTAK
jgi:hypothetical protein